MSDNWVVQNLQNALDTWNKYLSEIWQLITQSPEQFKGGSIWSVIVNIHDAVRAIGLALLVLFFVIGIVKTCGSFAEVKKPEHVLEVQKALKVMGYPTHAAERNGKTYLLPGEKQPESTKTLREEWKMARLEEQKEAASRLF